MCNLEATTDRWLQDYLDGLDLTKVAGAQMVSLESFFF